MQNYQIVSSVKSNGIKTVKRLSDGAFVPFDPANTDYQQYLKWLSEGNTPTPADEGAE
jgi:hypothetical protein